MNIALLTASGIGERMKNNIPKQFIHVNNKPIIIYTLEAFERHPAIDAIIVVCLEGWHDILRAYAKQFNITKLKWIVVGGKTGEESIENGLNKLKEDCNLNDIVIVHDGNRPLVSPDIISDNLVVQGKYGSAVAAIPCVEAIFETDNFTDSVKTIPREKLVRTQTPHSYSLEKLLWAHKEKKIRGISNTIASCDLMLKLGEKVYFSKGNERNLKITTKEDLEIFEGLLKLKGN